MEEGTLLGSFFVVGCIIFYLKIACFPDNYKTWYMYLPSIFVVYYLFKNNGTKAIIVLSIIIVTVSLIKNLDIYSKETGKERAELANVIVSKIKKPAVFYVNIENNDELWKFECFNSALKYLYPNENIIFKINYKPHPKMCDENVYFLTERNDVGVGDYFIVRKYDNSEILPDTRELIFENKVYQLYLIK